MGFLNRVSADGNLDTPKYRCIATFEFSEQLAKSVFYYCYAYHKI